MAEPTEKLDGGMTKTGDYECSGYHVTWWWCPNCNCYHTGDCPYKDEGEDMTEKLDRIIKILERIEKKVKS